MEHWPDVFYNVMCLLFSTVQFRKIVFYKLQDRERLTSFMGIILTFWIV